ncbi:hypothetical protein COK97_14250 [Bacillus cereus]|nr:hypothetical protein COK97_14250 [Bacillus cereus]
MDLIKLFKEWVDHPRGGSGRKNSEKTDEDWKDLLKMIHNWENSEDKVENEFAKYLKYTGKIRRVHLDHKEVKYNNHYVSWTSAENLEDIYWLRSLGAHTIITAEATNDNPGISVKGFIEAMKLDIPNFKLNSPAIENEQEIIFPLQKELISSTKKQK